MKKKVVIIHEELPADATVYEQDTIAQVHFIEITLQKLGYATAVLPVSLNLSRLRKTLKNRKPFLVFNLVESIDGTTRYLHFVPALLEESGVAFTGSRESALFLTTNKLLSKKNMLHSGISTPDWQEFSTVSIDNLTVPMPFIVKPSGDVTSRNIPETSVVRNDEQFFDMLNRFDGIQKNDFFIESFIAGRELNISLLSDSGRIEVLPPSEIVFGTFPEGKRRNVNYDVKWTPDSREYHHRSRTFEFLPEDQPLLNKCKKIACRCWECFGLHGYGRIDFRIDAQNNPWVIDVNANPCLAPDSGFIATARSAGYTYEGIITRILDGACFHSSRFRGNNGF